MVEREIRECFSCNSILACTMLKKDNDTPQKSLHLEFDDNALTVTSLSFESIRKKIIYETKYYRVWITPPKICIFCHQVAKVQTNKTAVPSMPVFV